MQEFQDYIYLLLALISLGGYLYTWLTGKSKANARCIAELETQVSENKNRLERIDERMNDIPTIRDEIKAVHNRIDQVAKTTNNLDGQMTQINNSLGVIQKALTKVPS